MKRVAFAFGFLHREALLTRQVCRNRRSSSSPRAGGQFNVLEGSNPTYWFCGLRSPSISRDLAPKNKISTLFPQDRLARREFLPLLGRRVHSVTCKSLADMPAGRRSGPRPASPVRDLAAGEPVWPLAAVVETGAPQILAQDALGQAPRLLPPRSRLHPGLPSYAPPTSPALTRDLASAFRSAIERPPPY